MYGRHLNSSFPKPDKRHSRKWVCNASAKFKNCVLVKNFSHMYMCVYVDIYEELFSKTWSPEVGIGSAISNFGLALNAFLEKSSSYIIAHSLNNCWWKGILTQFNNMLLLKAVLSEFQYVYPKLKLHVSDQLSTKLVISITKDEN